MTDGFRMPEIGQRLASARLRRGLSQATVARRSGVAPSYISRIENGRVQPSFRTVQRVADAVRVSVGELVSESETRDHAPGAGCPVTPSGGCLLDLLRPQQEVDRGSGADVFSPRQVRLLRRLARWLVGASADRQRAMEILLDDLTKSQDAPD
ncbi:MAG: helix-turn-helix transcriptional regulator [bacterium]|nr:helix-turn-helix transcriptional regulator [bacterium]